MMLTLTYLEIVILATFLGFGMISTFKTVKYILRFLYLNNNRTTLYHLSLTDPHAYNAQMGLGYVDGLKDIPSCSMRLMMWAVIGYVNTHLFTFYLFFLLRG